MTRIALLFAVFFALAGTAHAKELVLAKDGKSAYKIVLSKNASPSEHRASKELAYYLHKMSGASFPVVSKKSGPSILLGSGFLPKDVNVKELNDEGFVIRTVGSDLVIAGAPLRGTMYGVYTFLEDTLGCRWYTSRITRIPKMKTIKLQNLKIKEIPAFEYRDVCYSEAFEKEWAARNRVNTFGARLDKSTGGKYSYGRFCHTFHELVPFGVYFKDHPEYFSLVNGKRETNMPQLCLTNPDVIKISTETVKRWIKELPDAKLFSVSQNDWYNYCECDKCKAVYEEEGSPSGALLRFVNAIAEEIEKDYPDKIVDTIAYQWTEKPPKITKPRQNVRVRLCPIFACQAHPYEECPRNKAIVDNLRAWSKLTDCLYIWHYNTAFWHYLCPFPDFEQLHADTLMYKRFGVKGMYWEGAYDAPGSEFGEMRSWVLAKLAWNPNQDLNVLVNDYLNGCYGPAAPYIRQYYDMIHKIARDPNMHFDIWMSPLHAMFTPEFIAKSEGLFESAQKAVKGDPELSQRVEMAKLWVDYIELMRPVMTNQTAGREKELLGKLDLLFGRCKKYGIYHSEQGIATDVFYDRTRAALENKLNQ